MHNRRRGDLRDELALDEAEGAGVKAHFEVHAAAATLIYALLKHGLLDEAQEFQEWYLDTFDYDLET